MKNVKEKIIFAKNKLLVASASASVAVLATATNAFAEEGGGATVDYASIATNTQSSVISAINAMLPTLAVLFGTIAAVKFAPRLIKKFFG